MLEITVLDKLTEGNEFIHGFVAGKTDIIFTNISYKYIEMAINWYAHLSKINLATQAIVICFDAVAYQAMLHERIPAVFVDQDVVAADCVALKEYFKHNHQVAKVLTYYYLCKTYSSINFVYTDVDMVFLKSPIDKLKREIKNYDACVYVERDYSDCVYDHEMVKNYNTVGGLVICLSKDYWDKVFKNIKPFNMSDPTIGIKEYSLNLGVNFKLLNAFEFTTAEIWKQEHMRKLLRNICIAVHYTMPAEVDDLTDSELTEQIQQKINLMKQHNHWLLNGQEAGIRTQTVSFTETNATITPQPD